MTFPDTDKAATFSILITAIIFSSSGELLLKAGVNHLGEFGLTPGHLVRAAGQPWIVGGFTLFGIGALFWLVVLSRADLSWAYPMLAMGYLVVMAASRLLLGEAVSPQRWLAAAIIVFGVVIMFLSPERSQ